MIRSYIDKTINLSFFNEELENFTDWFNRVFYSNELLGDRIFNILLGIIGILFLSGWILLILYWIGLLVKNIIKKVFSFFGYSDYDFERNVDNLIKSFKGIINLFLKFIPESVRFLFIDNKRFFSYLVLILLGFLTPFFVAIIWFTSSNSPINDYLLITNSKIVDGYINKVEEGSYDFEINDRGDVESSDFYSYNYYFKLPDGNVYKSYGREFGYPSDNLLESDVLPQKVRVLYVSSNPNISRVLGMDANVTTIWQWIIRQFALGAICLLILFWYSFNFSIKLIKEYKKLRK